MFAMTWQTEVESFSVGQPIHVKKLYEKDDYRANPGTEGWVVGLGSIQGEGLIAVRLISTKVKKQRWRRSSGNNSPSIEGNLSDEPDYVLDLCGGRAKERKIRNMSAQHLVKWPAQSLIAYYNRKYTRMLENIKTYAKAEELGLSEEQKQLLT